MVARLLSGFESDPVCDQNTMGEEDNAKPPQNVRFAGTEPVARTQSTAKLGIEHATGFVRMYICKYFCH